jgi:CheY-like chemotaxis protein
MLGAMPRPRRLRVLIVDDQPALARSLARAFADEASIEVAFSGAEALDKMGLGRAFDLVVCDVMMPGMTGTQLFEKVRALDPSRATSFVFMSGGASPEEQARVDATGVRCLTKPVELEILRTLFQLAD